MGRGRRPWGPGGRNEQHLRAHRGAVDPHTDDTWWLHDTEQVLLNNMRRWEDEADSSKRWSIWQESLNLISHACGYQCQMSIGRIGWDFQCVHFQSKDQWGLDRYQHNEAYSLNNHVTMATDKPRVEAFRRALNQAASARRVLDVGSGPFCLLSRLALRAGASSVDCVEQNQWAVEHAIDMFKAEAAQQENDVMCGIKASLVGYDLYGCEHAEWEGKSRLSLFVGAPELLEGFPKFQKLQLFEGYSSEAPLQGGYDLVVHEILGHIASSEGVVEALNNLRHRGLLRSDCVFVPRRAATLFVPTMEIKLSCLERILCLSGNRREQGLHCLTKYHAHRFPEQMFLATPAVFEDLDFGGDLQTRRHAVVEFVTDRSGVFDGLHFHMLVDMDSHATINTLLDHTSWSTTYVKLLDPGIFLPVGSHIICETWVQLDRPDPLYSVWVSVGKEKVAQFSWSGCSG